MLEFNALETFSRTQATERKYGLIFEGLKRSTKDALASRAGGPIDEDGDLYMEVVEHFLEKRWEYEDATERIYRAAIVFELSKHKSHDPSAFFAYSKVCGMTNPWKDEMQYFQRSEDRNAAIALIEEIRSARKERKEHRIKNKLKANTSAQKSKAMSAEDIAKLIQRLDEKMEGRARKGKWTEDVKTWFQASYLTGLRPSEWANSELEGLYHGRSVVLKVLNGKGTNGRTFGETRRIVLSGLDEEQMAVVKKQVERATKMEEDGKFSDWYGSCRMMLQRVSLELWPSRVNHPTLYTARHLFAANAKAKLTKKEVAALMGHGAEVTAGRHYARRESSTGALGVEPSAEDLQALDVRNAEVQKKTGPGEDGFRGKMMGENER